MVRFDAALVAGFALALVRAAAWISFCPPFSQMGLPARVRAGLALALAMACAPTLADPALLKIDLIGFIGQLLLQALSGVALAFCVLVLFSALSAAGDMIDVVAGFSIGATIDPISGVSASPFAKLYQVFATAFFFACGGHILVVRGFLVSADRNISVDGGLGALGATLLELVTTMFLAALEVALPVLASLFIAEIALGLVSRAAPQLNVYVTGFAVKSIIALLLTAASLLILGNATESLIGQGLSAGLKVLGA